MIYLHNPEDTGSDIKDFVVGEPGRSCKYDIKKGETWGFEDEVAYYIIRIYGIEGGDKFGLNKGFLKMVKPQDKTKKVKGEVLIKEEDGKKIYQCSLCEFNSTKLALPVQGHIAKKHPDGVEVKVDDFKIQKGDKIVPPEEIDRLRRARQEMTSMKPKRSLADLRPKTEAEVGYRNPRSGVDIGRSGLNTRDSETAKSFYGPGLQRDDTI
jgi:hypothetical protein